MVEITWECRNQGRSPKLATAEGRQAHPPARPATQGRAGTNAACTRLLVTTGATRGAVACPRHRGVTSRSAIAGASPRRCPLPLGARQREGLAPPKRPTPSEARHRPDDVAFFFVCGESIPERTEPGSQVAEPESQFRPLGVSRQLGSRACNQSTSRRALCAAEGPR